MSLILALGIFVLTGLSSSYTTLVYTFDRYYEDYKTTDISIYTEPSSDAPLEQLKNEDGVAEINQRLTISALLEKSNGRGINGNIIEFFYR